MKMPHTGRVRLVSKERKNRLQRNEKAIAALSVILGLLLCLGSSDALAQSCLTASAGGGFVNASFAAQTGTFTATYDASVSSAPVNDVVTLTDGAQTSLSNAPVIVSFSGAGHFTARNGGAYGQTNIIPYSAGVTYHFRLAVNVGTGTYSVFVTAPGGAEQTVASNFAFRTGVPASSLNNLGADVDTTTSTINVCNFALGTTPPPPPPPGDFTISTASGAPSVDPGNPYPYSVWVFPENGFAGQIAFTVSGLPGGTTAAFKTSSPINPLGSGVPTTIRGGPAESTLTVSTSSSTPSGTFPLTITASSGSIVHTTAVSLTVNAPLPTFSVTTFGAKCDGSTNDAPAINNAIAAASSAGGGIVEFPAGRTCSSASIHLMSNVRLQLNAGSVISGHSGIDAPEPNSFSSFQDFGHSHFHDALIWGESLVNIGFQGSGTITGNGVLTTGNPGTGQGDKVLSLKECKNVTITGITITDGGHFGILANGGSNMSVSNLKILDSHNRDAFNLINSSIVVIDNSDIEGSDDAMVMKSDFALGFKGTNSQVYVSNSKIFSTGNNATQFGSETCGNFTNFYWANLDLTQSGKAGIGITSNDGAIIDTVVYDNIHITNAADPIFMKIDNEARCPGSPPPGLIRNISIGNVNATVSERGSTGEFSNTINGMPSNHISNVTVFNTQYTAIGGHPASDANITPPETTTGGGAWVPASLGTRPAYGWYVRFADNITFLNDSVGFASNDGRPSFRADSSSLITLDGLVFEEGTGSPYDLGFLNVSGFHVGAGTVSTTGAAPRVHAIGSTAN